MAIRYLLDTNICTYIAKHNPPSVRARFAKHSAGEFAISVITLGELCHGAEKSSAKEKSLDTLQQLQAAIQVVPIDEAVGQHSGQIRAGLEKMGQPIGNNDFWIAAHARAKGWTLVTNNEREFIRVKDLYVEN